MAYEQSQGGRGKYKKLHGVHKLISFSLFLLVLVAGSTPILGNRKGRANEENTNEYKSFTNEYTSASEQSKSQMNHTEEDRKEKW